eukprot:gene12297-8438_t
MPFPLLPSSLDPRRSRVEGKRKKEEGGGVTIYDGFIVLIVVGLFLVYRKE